MPFQGLEQSEKMTFLAYPFLCLIDDLYFSRGNNYYITPSIWMKACLLKRHPNLKNNVFVIPHGINTDLFSPSKVKQEHDKNLILFVGRMIALKGIYYLIHAIPLILKVHPDTIVIFIGPGEKRPYIDLLKRLGVPKDNYSFLGFHDKKSLIDYYRAADIFVLPSFSESFSLTLVEAMSCGVPPVVTNVGGPSEIVEDHYNGLLIPPGSTRELADAIIFLLDNPAQRAKMGNAARETIEKKFSWSTAANMTSLIYQLLHGRH
jgi:glycosyltransferase involved in cell wall biosynthesis